MGDALSRYRQAEPRKDALARYKQPEASTLGALAQYLGLTGYLERQGRYANEGLALADQGAGELRNANPWGALNMPLGALGYLTSPINALLPSSDEIDATNMSPEARRLLTAGTAGMMAVMPGGPKGKGLGRGMASLADDVTDAERAALATRLQGEATQLAPPIKSFAPRPRDEALRNLTEARQPHSLRLNWSDPAKNDYVFDVVSNGKTVARLSGELRDDGKTFFVGGFYQGGANHGEKGMNALGPSAIRDVMRSVKQQFPTVESISGKHVGGAHRQQPRTVTRTLNDRSGAPVTQPQPPSSWWLATET